ncbi:MAG: nucleotide exchange factor GrpE [Hyphomonadaceae bacterium]
MSNEADAQPELPPQTDAPAELAPFEAELNKARDELLRALAEVENTRRRAEKQAQDARLYAIDRFARDLLPVADTMARALAAMPPEAREAADETTKTFFSGVELTERALIEAFARHGLRRVGAKGEPFDPNVHQAVVQTPSDQPAGTVIEVLQPGYVLADRTLRAAMVQVSAGPAAKTGDSATVDIKV